MIIVLFNGRINQSCDRLIIEIILLKQILFYDNKK